MPTVKLSVAYNCKLKFWLPSAVLPLRCIFFVVPVVSIEEESILPVYNFVESLNCHVPAAVTTPSKLNSFWQEKNKEASNIKRKEIFSVFIR